MFGIQIVKDFLIHRFKAKNRHGLHSPFVYNLVDEFIYDFRAKNVYPEIEKLRKGLSQNKSQSIVSSPKTDQLLYRLVAGLKPDNLIMLGPVNDITKHYIQRAAPNTKLYTDIVSRPEELDLIFISTDGNEQVLKRFEDCLPKVHENTMMIINGIYLDKSRKQAWATIIANSKVTVTVDLFWMGLVFFRKGQAKEDFLIKFV
jgi:hypothetical protein